MLAILDNLEKDATQWGTVISSSVNSKMSTQFKATSLKDGRLLVTNIGDVTYAGGLVGRRLAIPESVLAGSDVVYPAFAQLRTLITIPGYTSDNIGRLETDFIAVFVGAPNSTTPTANKANCSTQINLSTGHFEVSGASGSWVDIGDGPGTKLVPDVEHELIIKCAFDVAGMKHSVQSITWDGKVYPVPPALQGVTFQTSNWGTAAHIQLQNEMFNPGVTLVVYRGTELRWNDSVAF